MAKKADLIQAADAIRQAILDFVPETEPDKIRVFESSPGILRVVVGSTVFRDMGISKRQETIWKHLRKNVEEVHLRYCLGVHVLDLEEYAAEFFPQSSSSAASLYIHGQELAGDTDE